MTGQAREEEEEDSRNSTGVNETNFTHNSTLVKKLGGAALTLSRMSGSTR